jgi:two-component system, cell cycle sensor histidine kinase and response regulator CckA
MKRPQAQVRSEVLYSERFPTPAQSQESSPNKHIERLLVDKSRDLLCTHDLTGKILSVNSPPARVLGYTEEELLQMRIQDLLAPQYRPMFDDYISTLQEQQAARGLMMLVTRTGEQRIWEYHNVLRSESGTSIIFGIAHDVTETRRAEEKLRRLGELNRAITANALEGIIVFDRELRYVVWNRYMERITGTGEDQVLGKHVLDVFPFSQEQSFYGLLKGALTGNSIDAADITIGPSGMDKMKWFSTTISPLRDAQDQITGVLTILHDITERKLGEDRLKESYRSASLLWSIAHTINNSGSPEQVLQSAVDGIVESLGCDVVLCFLEKDGTLPLIAISHTAANFRDLPVHRIGECLCGLAIQQGMPLYSSDICRDPRCTWEECKNAGLRSFAALPMKTGTGTIGVLGLGSVRLQDFGKDSPLLETLAAELSLVVKNAVLLRDVSTRATALEREVEDRKRVQEALRRSEAQLRSFVENAPYAITRASVRGNRFLNANPSAAKILGYDSEDELLALKLSDLYVDPRGRDLFLSQLRPEVTFRGVELRWKRKDGKLLTLRGSARLRYDEVNNEDVVEGIFEDVTERLFLEEQLLQAQKMEALGRLAGGVAHDFNNLLGVILGYCELLAPALASNPRSRQWLDAITQAGHRGASLTARLLAFGRRQVLRPTVLNLNNVARETEKMLRPLIGEDVELKLVLDPGLGAAKADSGQIAQVILNLVINARDAMPQGGKIVVETANIDLDNAYAAKHEPLKPGAYVMLSVSDEGVGMDETTKARIFEPFFTTKEVGKGTGLGLSTVHGVVKQSEGSISVYSEPGQGTTFKIYLPRVDQRAEPIRPDIVVSPLVSGTETILVVEDDEALRSWAVAVLESSGYNVLSAGNAATALVLAQQHNDKINLLLTDVIMPGMAGPELVEKTKKLRPELKVLYMSGYAGDTMERRGVHRSDSMMLAKPFSTFTLLTKVRAVLES